MKSWGVKIIKTVNGQESSRWYTNERHTQADAVELAAHYDRYNRIDPLDGNKALFRAEEIPEGESY